MKLNLTMKPQALLSLCAAAVLCPLSASAAPPKEWTFDLALYGLADNMSGELGIGPVTADVDIGLDDILENLEFGIMGTFRVGCGPWAITVEGLFLGVQGETRGVTADLDQWLVEPTLSYRVSKYFEPLAGVRYNNLSAELRGPGILPIPIMPSGTRDWWDPIVGANLTLPLGKQFSLKLRGDIGGFGIGSEVTWQLYPYLDWRFAKWGSMQAGYRWLYMDYETGSGADRFAYDMLNQGAQIGFTFHF